MILADVDAHAITKICIKLSTLWNTKVVTLGQLSYRQDKCKTVRLMN